MLQRSHADKSERGVYLLIVAGGIVALLTLVGLVIDAANLFRARLALQSAADAGAIAGLAYIATYDTSSDTHVSTGQDIARRILCQNLEGQNVQIGGAGQPCHSSLDITTTWSNDRIHNPSLTITATGDVNLYVMNMVYGLLRQRAVSALATSEINRAHVSLMLDTSDSMKCDANQTDTAFCGCTGAGNVCDYSVTKLKYLKHAAKNFLDFFDPGRDRINLIPYNTGASMVAPHGEPFMTPFAGAGTTFNRPLLKQRIGDGSTGLQAAGLTNPCDALLQSYLESERLGVLDQTAYVMFSDGAPTAARFWFAYNANWVGAPACTSTNWNSDACLYAGARTHGSMQTNNVWKRSKFVSGTPSKPINRSEIISLYDYYSWGYTTTVTGPNVYSIIPARLIAAPGGVSRKLSPCHGTTTYTWTPYGFPGPGMPSGVCPDTNDGACNKACPQCSYMLGYEDRPAFAWLCFGSNTLALKGVAPFYTPDGQLWHTPYVDQPPPPAPPISPDPHQSFPVDIEPNPHDPAGTNAYRWWRMYYDCAVAMSDAARHPGGLHFTIGLGMPAGGTGGDPYQTVTDVFNRKDIFLRRLAHDVCGINDPPFEGVDNYAMMQAKGYRHGMALLTTDAAELDDLFRAVALKIKAKLLR